MNENWRPIPGLEDRYHVSDRGRVKSISFMQRYIKRNGMESYRRTKEKIIAQQLNNSGYFLVHLHRDNARVALLVHRIVATVFIGASDLTVNHKDLNKESNSADNLEYCTYAENHQHAIDAGHRKNLRKVSFSSGESVQQFVSIESASRCLGRSSAYIKRRARLQIEGFAFV
jgi:hypothetical protein